MYKILQVDNRKNGVWFDPGFTTTFYTDLKTQGYGGIYLLAHQITNDNQGHPVIQDNLFLDKLFNDAQTNGLRVGFYIMPDGIKLSYAKEFQDLAFKRNAFGSSLLPAVLITAWPANYKANQVEGDFVPYFNSLLVQPLGNVVLGFSKATGSLLVNSGSTAIMNMMRQDGCRLWYVRPGLTAQAMSDELKATPVKKEAWIAGISLVEHWADWQVVPPDHTCPTGQHWDDAKGKCVDDVPVPPEDDIYTQIANHFRAIADLIDQL